MREIFKTKANLPPSEMRDRTIRVSEDMRLQTLHGVAVRNEADALKEVLLGYGLNPEDHPEAFEKVRKIRNLGHTQAEHSYNTRNGMREIEQRLHALHAENAGLAENLYKDTLTEIGNRLYFDQALDILMSGEEKFTLLAFDIDHFKSVNDTYGHDAGDNVLKIFAGNIRTNIAGGDNGDIVARYGGEEFFAIIRAADAKTGENVAERIRQAVADRPAEKDAPAITVSIGVAEYMPGETAVDFRKRADVALYAAKHGGRNRVVQAQLPETESPAVMPAHMPVIKTTAYSRSL